MLAFPAARGAECVIRLSPPPANRCRRRHCCPPGCIGPSSTPRRLAAAGSRTTSTAKRGWRSVLGAGTTRSSAATAQHEGSMHGGIVPPAVQLCPLFPLQVTHRHAVTHMYVTTVNASLPVPSCPSRVLCVTLLPHRRIHVSARPFSCRWGTSHPRGSWATWRPRGCGGWPPTSTAAAR